MKILKWLTAILSMLTLVACGGGGGSAGTSQFGSGGGSSAGTGTGTGTSTSSGTTSIVLSISKTTITVGSPATLTATVTTSAGAAAAGQVVSFSTASGLGALSASSALTDASGMASVQISPASTTANGADLAVATLVTSSTSTAASSPSATIGFQTVAAAGPSAGTPTVAVALSSTSVTSTVPVTLTATLRDGKGTPVANQIVKFSTIDKLGTFNVPSALSDAAGKVSAKLSPATTSTSGADLAVVTATVNDTVVTGTVAFSVTSTGATVVGVPALTLALSTTSVTTSTPATATATVKDASGAGVVGQVVKFSTVDGLGTFDTTSALTNASGVASVTLSARTAGVSGADQVVASTTVNGTPLQASQGFRLTAPNVAIGTFTSDVGGGALSAYGQANLTVVLTGAPAGTPVSVSLSSGCVIKGKASLTPAASTTSTGTATFTYRDLGCGATDATDTVQASVGGILTSLSVRLTSPTVGSINFISASPTTIYLKGSGYTETSSVIFRVVDTAGNGLPNQLVLLEPTTLSGGLTVDNGTAPVTKLSDSLGNVNVTINSGTVPTPVRIKATLSGLGISTVSSSLSIAVGLPSELNFSLSQGTINIEGFNIDGTPNTYSIIASDRLANPVPVGTAINFIAEGGQIEPTKFTALTNGLARATANFITSSPRPADGRITVVAYALGEESFFDTNGNNIYDTGEQFQDLGNIYLDRLFDGTYDNATDQFIALSLPGVSSSLSCNHVFSAPLDPLLAGNVTIPSVPTTCDSIWGRAYVRRAVETVFSTSAARPLWIGTPAGLSAGSSGLCTASKISLITGYTAGVAQSSSFYTLEGATSLYGLPTTGTLQFLVADRNSVRLNPVAAGSTISVAATTGLTATVNGGSPVPSTANATIATIQYTFTTATSGTITANITSPGGVTTSVPFGVSTNSIPAGAVACP